MKDDSPRLADALEPFGDPPQYDELLAWNIAVVDRALQRPAVRTLVERLARMADLDVELAALDFKRYLLSTYEYRPQFLRRRRFRSLKHLLALPYLYLTGLRRRIRGVRVVLVDDWYEGSEQSFYGSSLVRSLEAMTSVEVTSVTAHRHVYARDLAWALRARLALRKAVSDAARAEGLDLDHYVFTFLRHVLAGRSLRQSAAPRVILTGHDNDFPPIRAWTARARLVSVQNGSRFRASDSAFVYADHYLAIDAPRLTRERNELGCRLGEVQNVGSIRLARHLAARVAPPAATPAHDVLFISQGHMGHPEVDRIFGHWYLERFDLGAVRLLNALAETGMEVAYYPDDEQEFDNLRAAGLLSPAVRYLDYTEAGVYRAIEDAAVVLSTLSTTVFEALALGRPAACINLSGNRSISQRFTGLVFEGEGGEDGLRRFVESLAGRQVDVDDYIVQREDLFGVVAGTVKRAAGLTSAGVSP